MDSSTVLALICVCGLGLLVVVALVAINVVVFKNKDIKNNLELALHSGGSATSGCLALLSASAVLIGFVLPWASCQLSYIASGQVSGLNALVALITAFLADIGIITDKSQDVRQMGGSLGLILFIALILVILIPIMGFRIGKLGFELSLLLVPSSHAKYRRKDIAKSIIISSAIGILPLLLYFSSLGMTRFNIGGLSNLGIGVTTTDIGIWVTASGFILALGTGIAMYIFLAFNEQITQLRSFNEQHPTRSTQQSQDQQAKPRLIPESQSSESLPEPITKEEWDALRLMARGYSETDIASELSLATDRINLITDSLFRKFVAGDKEELIRKAKEKGYIRFEVDKLPPKPD